MAVTRNILKNETYEELGRNIIDSYVDNLATRAQEKKPQLHYWYVAEYEINGEMMRIGHGIVTGHKKLPDALDMHTSAVKAVYIDEDEKEILLTTQNNVYYCPLEYCSFEKQDKFPEIIPGYENIKEKYKDRIEYPSIEAGKVLLVLSNFCDYYFHSLYFVPEDSKDGKKLESYGSAHVGTFQDSFLVGTKGYGIDLRYFPYY